MKSNNVHYEVLGQRGTSWTIIAVIDDQQKAVARAKEVEANFRAVKVMRERFDAQNNTYRSGQIYFSGAQQKASKFDSEDMPTVCWKVEDFYSYEGRRAINKLLRKELMEWGLTATELLHDPDKVQKMQDTGTSVQRAVQQTAILQVRETGQGVQERIKQIYDLIDRGTKLLIREAPAFPDIQNNNFDEVVELIGGKESRKFLLCGGFAKFLTAFTDFNDKMTKVLGLVRADHPDWVHEVADGFVAELLSLGNVLPVLIGQRASLKEEIAVAADLAAGRADTDDACLPPDARMVNRLIEAGKMPATQQSLTRYLVESMQGSRRLQGKTILEDAIAVTELTPRLKRGGERWIGEIAMSEAISKRCARWLHPEAISELIGPVEDAESKFNRLVELSRHVHGNANSRKLGEFVVPVVMSPQGEVFLTLEGGSVPVRMRRLRAMQDNVLRSGLQDIHKKKLVEKLDELCCRVLRGAHLIERVLRGPGNMTDRCVGLLKMILQGYFTHGMALSMAQAAVRKCMVAPEFIPTFLMDVESQKEKLERLEALDKMLRRAGIPLNEAGGNAPEETPPPASEPGPTDEIAQSA